MFRREYAISDVATSLGEAAAALPPEYEADLDKIALQCGVDRQRLGRETLFLRWFALEQAILHLERKSHAEALHIAYCQQLQANLGHKQDVELAEYAKRRKEYTIAVLGESPGHKVALAFLRFLDTHDSELFRVAIWFNPWVTHFADYLASLRLRHR